MSAPSRGGQWGARLGRPDDAEQEMMAMTDDDVFGWRRELEAVQALLERLECTAGVG
ncbi:MAG: hypothetical protein ACXVEW_04525 [Solirubrobacteraceae bacterium]